MNLKEQLYVIKLADTGNLTHAAQQLYISQPALSLYIRNLENSLGVKLFTREGRRFLPTPAGKLYIDKARQILTLGEAFDQELANLSNGCTQRIALGMQSIRAPQLISLLYPWFIQKHPEVSLQMYDNVYSELEKQLCSDQIDLFICNQPIIREDFIYQPICDEEILLIVNRSHPLLAHAVPSPDGGLPWIDLNLFSDERFLLNSPMQSLRYHTDKLMAHVGVRPKSFFIIRGINAVTALVNCGAGIGFTCGQYLRAAPQRDQVVALRVGQVPHFITLCAIYKRKTSLTPIAEEMIEYIRTSLTD